MSVIRANLDGKAAGDVAPHDAWLHFHLWLNEQRRQCPVWPELIELVETRVSCNLSLLASELYLICQRSLDPTVATIAERLLALAQRPKGKLELQLEADPATHVTDTATDAGTARE